MTFTTQPVDANGRAIPYDGWDATNNQFTIALTGPGTAASGQPFNYAPAVMQQAVSNAAVAAGVGTAAQVIKAGPGYLSGVLVTSAGTAATSIYDNASAASGTVIGYIPANPTAGTFYPFNMPATNGITVGKVANSSGLTVAYS